MSKMNFHRFRLLLFPDYRIWPTCHASQGRPAPCNEESFFVRHAYFLGATDPYKSLKTIVKVESTRKLGPP